MTTVAPRPTSAGPDTPAAPAAAAALASAVAAPAGRRGARTAWGRLLRALGHVPATEAHPCMYAGCATVVGPHQGWRSGWLVFCSDDCAAADQGDAIL